MGSDYVIKEVESRLKSGNNPLLLLDFIESEFSWLRDEMPELGGAIDEYLSEIEQILSGHLPLTDAQKEGVNARVFLMLITLSVRKPQSDC
ncbi:hypothetical protein [Leucothrix mucor]|uniref:hypothetical protein n=1 Tax=Leucothrix mucor TaxID=45248 RepID=UPI0003B3C61F|nr:hypothetical protein [Leucothrix mucor]